MVYKAFHCLLRIKWRIILPLFSKNMWHRLFFTDYIQVQVNSESLLSLLKHFFFTFSSVNKIDLTWVNVMKSCYVCIRICMLACCRLTCVHKCLIWLIIIVCIKHVVCVHVTCMKSQTTSVWMHTFLQALCVCVYVCINMSYQHCVDYSLHSCIVGTQKPYGDKMQVHIM